MFLPTVGTFGGGIFCFCKSLKIKFVTVKSLTIVETQSNKKSMSKEKNTIKLQGSDYTMKVGMKAIVVFEALTEKAFEIKTQTDVLAYIYAAILAGTPGTKLGFDEMLDAFDDDPKALEAAIAIAVPESAMEKLVKAQNGGGPEPKKG